MLLTEQHAEPNSRRHFTYLVHRVLLFECKQVLEAVLQQYRCVQLCAFALRSAAAIVAA